MNAASPSRPRRFLTRQDQAARWSKSVKTVERWGRDPNMGLPPEYWLGNKPHRREDELETWERSRIGAIADAPSTGRAGEVAQQSSTRGE